MRIILLPPDLSGAALAELKSWLAIGGAGEDALLLRLLAAAHDACARFTGLTPLRTHYTQSATGGGRGPIGLSTGPVEQVLALRAVGDGMAVRPLPAEGYTLVPRGDGRAELRLAERIAEARVEIDYVAGLAADWEACDPALREGMLRLAAHLYTQRDPALPQPPPAAVAALWRPWRRATL